MDYRQIKTLKEQVKYVLEHNAETRNSDITLTIEVWKTFQPYLIGFNGQQRYIALEALYDLPREDNIKRIRAHFQNVKKRFLPTELSVALKRGITEDEWRVSMGYPTKESAGTENPSWRPPSLTKSV